MRRREGDAQRFAREQHDGLRRARDLGQELRMPRERRAGLCDDTFLHGRRHERSCGSRDTKLRCTLEHLKHVAGIARVELAGLRAHAQRDRQHLQAAGLVRRDVAGACAFEKLGAAAELARARLQELEVAEHGETCGERPRRQGERDVRADAGRLAGADDDQRWVRDHGCLKPA
jgi:hypothetical protein